MILISKTKGAAASALKAWDAMPQNVKKMFADNADVLSKKKARPMRLLNGIHYLLNSKSCSLKT